MCDTSVPMTLQIELSNEQEQTQLFFLSNGKKLWVVLPYTPTLSRVFSATFSTWFSSLRSQSNSSQFFKTFFSYHCHTLAKIWKKKYYGPCENTHLYTWNCDFLHSPPANLLIYLFNEVAQIFYQYIARMCINMISLGGDKLKCPCF